MPITDEIRRRREKAGLTQEQAADRAGMHQPAWAKIELGVVANPTIDTLRRMADALGCSVGVLLK